MKVIITIFSIFLFLNVSAQTITYLKVADRPEYEKYLSYCNTPVPRTFYIKGAVSLLKVNNYYVQGNSDWVVKVPLTIKWYPIGTNTITLEPYQKEITAKVEIFVPMRYPASVDDFYRNWKTRNIQDGLVDSKTCGVYYNLK